MENITELWWIDLHSIETVHHDSYDGDRPFVVQFKSGISYNINEVQYLELVKHLKEYFVGG